MTAQVMAAQNARARQELAAQERRDEARRMYAESVAAELPMTARALGEAFGRSARWGRDRIAEVRATDTTAQQPPAGMPTPAPVLPDVPAQAPAAEADSPAAEEPASVPEPRQPEQGPAGMPPDAGGMPADGQTLRQLTYVRWGVRATLTLGVVASTVANVLHANDNVISQTIAAWPPLALLATIELISRVPVYRRTLASLRFVATAIIAAIAAWVSYWHMAEVIRRYGETGESPYLIPLTVDGLIVVASICLVELGSRIRVLTARGQ